ncbi:DNA-binding HxlR family transcriptional regulator [Diaminobutyricimonas aerilata]|uniref:DNA-binding HxlR family transcriptional regulator n=1 Tax=Diaminobutyricimonas aerilata TaxID=1162967 RepID=A0A2M9CNB5_9MICO|nr:helix-turn-helix domain-containing protein [Diaminobutyricimonas aerilata]PJJ73399.1 DNA-binding HxlR family transcriptional regulator [Diaminobutyricimonas aerilata]
MIPAYQQIDDEQCRHFLSAVDLVGQRWSGAILLALARGATRFSDVRANVAGISDRMLAVRLKTLAADGLVERTIIPTTPVQVRYGLTESGAELLESLQPLTQWAHRWNPEPVVEAAG